MNNDLKKLFRTTIICFVFMLGEIIGGWVVGSVAILADGFHLLSDLLAFIVSIVGIKLMESKPNDKYPFGYSRA